MGILFQTMYSCLPPFIQYAGISAFKGDQQVIEKRIDHYKVLRGIVVKNLNEIPGVFCLEPEGACYAFANIKGTGMSSAEFADFVLENAGIALLPGSCFGKDGEGYVRLCYLRKPEVIVEACNRMKKLFSKKLYGKKAESRVLDAVCIN